LTFEGRSAAPSGWRVGGEVLPLDRPLILGVLNVTPDSFSDGGLHLEPDAALAHAWSLVEEGADLIDVGGESSRPGAAPVDAREEWRRIAPVVERASELPVPLSVDTTKHEVAARALEAGAAALNDISALRFEPRLADLAAAHGAGLILMHMRGNPRSMQDDVIYGDLMAEVKAELAAAVAAAEDRGCGRDQLVVDPGIGFGKSPRGNAELLARLPELAELGLPILVGPSRKSFIGQLLGLPVEQRLEGTLAACVAALDRGARLFRVHDVAAARRALDLAEAVRREGAKLLPVATGPAGNERG
jgi:dihydropteroate synthase